MISNRCCSNSMLQVDGNDDCSSDDEYLQGQNSQSNFESAFNVKELDKDMSSLSQFDGMEDIIEGDSINQAKMIFAVNCERVELIQLVNFLRSLNTLWLSSSRHRLCKVEAGCFYCHIRSSFLRLRLERQKGPFALKLNEFVCQIGRYESELNFNLITNLFDIKECIDSSSFISI